jgi:sugar phosphate isomerase/epimerase
MTFRLAAAESTLEGRSLAEKFDHALALGFDGLELAGAGDGVFAARAEELRTAHAAGVVMPTVVAHVKHFVGDPDPDRRRRGVADLKALLATVAEAGGSGVVTPHAYNVFSLAFDPATMPAVDERLRDEFRAALAEVAQYAVTVGAVVYLEPLNRYEDLVVRTLADARAYVEQIASPGLAVVADTFHMSIEEADIGAAIRRHGHLIKHVQLGDSNRLEPGAGHYDWAETLDALEAVGYPGWLAMECGLSGPASDVLPRVSRLLGRRP